MWDHTTNLLAPSSPLPTPEDLHAAKTWWQKQFHAQRDRECGNPFLFRNSCFDTISFAKMHKRFWFIFKNKLGNLECCHKEFLGSSLSLEFFQAYFPLGFPVKLFKLPVPVASWTFQLDPLILGFSLFPVCIPQTYLFCLVFYRSHAVHWDVWCLGLGTQHRANKGPKFQVFDLFIHTASRQLARYVNMRLPSTGWLSHLFHHFPTLCALTLRTVSNYSVRY